MTTALLARCPTPIAPPSARPVTLAMPTDTLPRYRAAISLGSVDIHGGDHRHQDELVAISRKMAMKSNP